MRWMICLGSIVACVVSLAAQAAIPEALHFSGRLDTGSTPMNGDVQVIFTLYTDPTSTDPSAQVWTATQTVSVSEGRFHVQLTGVTQAMLAGGVLHLGMTVAGEPEMSPRVVLLSVPYARQAANAVLLEGQTASEFAPSAHTHPTSELQHVNCTAGQVLTSDGTAWICGTKPVTVEDDPEVGLNTVDTVPKWDGSALVAGSITDTGNVGIGVVSPAVKLDVGGDLQIRLGTNNNTNLWFSNAAGSQTGAIEVQPSGAMLFTRNSDTSGFVFRTGASAQNSVVTITGGGHVGIGLTSPDQKLHVATGNVLLSNNRFYMVENLAGDDVSLVGLNSANNLQIGQGSLFSDIRLVPGGSKEVRITTAGDVGIGTSTPQGVLDLGSGTSGRGLVWGGSSGTHHYSSLFTTYSSGNLNLAFGYRGATDQMAWEYSYASQGRSAISLQKDGIVFFADPVSTETVGSVATPTERMRITDTGRVSIGGNTSPIEKLEIQGSGNEYLRIVGGGQGFTAAGIKLETTTSANRPSGVYMYSSVATETIAKKTWYMGRQYNIDVWGVGRTQDTDTLDTSAADKSNALLAVTAAGRVGIGLTSPSDELHVVSANPTIRLDESGVRAWRIGAGEYSSGKFSIADSSVGARLVIDGSGNVGIGTSSPTHPLHVKGDVKVDGRIHSLCAARLRMYQGICYAHAVKNNWGRVAAVSATMTSQDDSTGNAVCWNYVGSNAKTNWSCHNMPYVYPTTKGGDVRAFWGNCEDPAPYTWFNPDTCAGQVMVCCYK